MLWVCDDSWTTFREFKHEKTLDNQAVAEGRLWLGAEKAA